MTHSLFRRAAWHPLVAAIPFAFLVWRLIRHGPSPLRWAGIAVGGPWLVLAVFNLKGNRVLDWLYSDD